MVSFKKVRRARSSYEIMRGSKSMGFVMKRPGKPNLWTAFNNTRTVEAATRKSAVSKFLRKR